MHNSSGLYGADRYCLVVIMSAKTERGQKDFSDEVNAEMPSLLSAAQSDPHNVADVLLGLLALEKKTRLGGDSFSTARVAKAILDVAFGSGDMTSFNAHIVMLSKRRAQLQRVLETIVQYGATFVPKCADDVTKRKLIETLRSVSAGKMFVELDRARLTRTLAAMDESVGDVAAAADVLQEVTVETIGAMENAEKMDFLLEQIRLCLARGDYVRAEIISKKVDGKQLKLADFEAERVRFHYLMITYFAHFGRYADIAKAFREIYYTPQTQKDVGAWKHALSSLVVFAILTPFDAESADVINRIAAEKRLRQLPLFKSVVEQMTSDELMPWPLHADAEWRAHDAFTRTNDELGRLHSTINRNDSAANDTTSKSTVSGAVSAAVTQVAAVLSAATSALTDRLSAPSASDSELSDADQLIVHDSRQRWKDLHRRVVEHNVRVIAKYYRRMSIARLSELLSLSASAVERVVCELVVSGQLYARIDRTLAVISFVPAKDSPNVVNAFRGDVNDILRLIDGAINVIGQEQTKFAVKA